MVRFMVMSFVLATFTFLVVVLVTVSMVSKNSQLQVQLTASNETKGMIEVQPTVNVTPTRYECPIWHKPQQDGYNNYFKVLSVKRNLVVNWIPKVMSTSLRRGMAQMECGIAATRCNAVDGRIMSHVDICNMTRVIFFRDPFERAYSAYQNSFANIHVSVPGCASSYECSFDQWVEAIHRDRNTSFRNMHIGQQTFMAQFPKMHYHYYLRVSSPIDQKFFWNVLAGLSPLKMNEFINATTSVLSLVNKIGPETIQRLAEIYTEDLDMWERFLRLGTPRQEGEYTIYDYYVENLKK